MCARVCKCVCVCMCVCVCEVNVYVCTCVLVAGEGVTLRKVRGRGGVLTTFSFLRIKMLISARRYMIILCGVEYSNSACACVFGNFQVKKVSPNSF